MLSKVKIKFLQGIPPILKKGTLEFKDFRGPIRKQTSKKTKLEINVVSLKQQGLFHYNSY